MTRQAYRVTSGPLPPNDGRVVPRICGFLETSRNRAVDDAVLAALPSVQPAAAPRLVDVLLARGNEPALVALIQTCHLLAASEQDRLAAHATRLSSALRAALAQGRPQVSRNAVSLIRRADDPRTAYLLAHAVCDPDESVSALAADALAELAAALVHPEQRPGPADKTEPRRALCDAVMRALETFDRHRQLRVVEAAMRLTPLFTEDFAAVFSERRRRIARAAVEVFQRASDPDLVHFAYFALATPALREPIARSLADRVRPAFLVAMIRQAGRIEDPGVRTGLRLIRRLAWLRHGASPLLALPVELHEQAVRFLLALGLLPPLRLELMRELIMIGPVTLQRPALEAVIVGKLEPDGRILRTVAAWADPVLSPIAQAGLSATETLLPYTLGSPQSNTMASPQDAPAEVDVSISRQCRSSRSAERMAAVRAARTAPNSSSVSAAILRLARDSDARVRSAALSALRDGARPIHGPVLTEALQHADPRVRANAIDALDRLGFHRELSALADRINDPDNRVRANLVRALLHIDLPRGREALRNMLESADRSFRISGLWVAMDQARRRPALLGPEIGAAVSRICEEDPDLQIRRRADQVRRSLKGLALAGVGGST